MFVTAYILLVQKFVDGADPYGLACWQALGGMVLSFAAAVIFEPFPSHLPLSAWIAIIYAGTIGFALTLVLQTIAQKYTSATHVAILLSTSGIFGSAAGIIFIGEPMTVRIFAASALILAGVLTVEAVPAMMRRRSA
jgi:drug/metabolite transporter (DMT)-like permease